MASQSNSDIWMGAASSDMSMPSNPVLELEEEMSWKASASSQNTTNMELKDNLSLDWYTPQTPLMELSYSSPYGIPDTRSSFDLLDSSLNFDISNTLITSFRSAPSFAPTLGMGLESSGRNHILEDLTCTGQGSSVGLLSSISPGGQLGRSNQLDSFSPGLPSSFNQGIIMNNNAIGGSFSNNNMNITSTGRRTSNFPLALPIANSAEAYNPAPPRAEHILPYPQSSQLQRGQPTTTLFQKRAASRRGTSVKSSPPRVITSAISNDSGSVDTNNKESSKALLPLSAPAGRVEINSGSDDPNDCMGLDGDDLDDGKDDLDDLDESGDGSGGPYEVEEGAGNGAENNNNNLGKGNGKGKRGLPAKNLMAERRRRKKLNDRLYMLRSVVPKITKMDRASILGDAIEYLKELLQRINDIHNELEAAKLEQSRSMPSSPNPRANNHGFMAATVKEECPVLPNPESQPPRVEVRKKDGQALNIHMFCARRPGLLLSTVRALDAMGLDVQQAVISCFNGFAMDLFRAEAKDVALGPEEIKAVLLLTAGCGSMSSLQ